MWAWILLACALAFATKLLGYLIPHDVLATPVVERAAGAVTIGLLAALIASNALSTGQAIHIDARLAALVVAGVALWLRAPFLVVVILGALTAALLRAWGIA